MEHRLPAVPRPAAPLRPSASNPDMGSLSIKGAAVGGAVSIKGAAGREGAGTPPSSLLARLAPR
jgi:hypothetical protein